MKRQNSSIGKITVTVNENAVFRLILHADCLEIEVAFRQIHVLVIIVVVCRGKCTQIAYSPFSARNKDFCGNGFILAGCARIDFIRSFFYHQSAADDIVEAKLLHRDFQCDVSRLARGNVFHTDKIKQLADWFLYAGFQSGTVDLDDLVACGSARISHIERDLQQTVIF